MTLRPDKPGASQRARTLTEGSFGVYLDPIAMGLTVVDQSMIRSLQAAWTLCKSGLHSQIDLVAPRALTIRLSPAIEPAGDGDRPLLCLDGESAGLLFACGMYAAGRRIGLDGDATTSVMLDNDRPEQLLPVSDDSIRAKLSAARQAGMKRVVLETAQAERHRQYGQQLGLAISGAATVAEAFELLTGDARMERVLAAYSEARLAEWQVACSDPEDADGLTHYIEPHYALLPPGHRPFDTSERLAERGPDATRPADPYQRVPGDGDAALVHLLTASRLLCVTEDAGTGKSIMTRRVQALLSSPAGRSALTDDRACLAARWESEWPDDILEGLARRLEAACRQVAPSLAPRDVARWALRQGRVLLILDALDQVTSAQTLVKVANFLDSEDGCQCRVLMTSRSFEVPQKHQTHSSTSYGAPRSA